MTVLNPVADLERRCQALNDEIATALHRYSMDDPMVMDLKRRFWYLRDEIERLRNGAAFYEYLH